MRYLILVICLLLIGAHYPQEKSLFVDDLPFEHGAKFYPPKKIEETEMITQNHPELPFYAGEWRHQFGPPASVFIGPGPHMMDLDWNSPYHVSWRVNCNNEDPADGFWDRGYCVPGEITYKSWYLRYPKYTRGDASHYALGMMEIVLRNRGIDLTGYKGAVVLMSCAHLYEKIWLQRPGYTWEGPYLVVDCSAPYHLFVTMVEGFGHLEISYELWEEWGRIMSILVFVLAVVCVLEWLGDSVIGGWIDLNFSPLYLLNW